MIEKIIVRSFKSIIDQEIQTGRFNVFIGGNGSGKSNILEAIGILSAAASGRVDDESIQRRGVRPGTPRLYKSAFDKRIKPHIYFEARSEKAGYCVSLNNALENPRPAWWFKSEKLTCGNKTVATRGPRTSTKNREQGVAALKLVTLEENNPATLLLDVLKNYAVFTPNTPVLRSISPDKHNREPVGLSGGGLPGAVRELQKLSKENEGVEDALEDVLDLIDWVDDFDTIAEPGPILSASVSRTERVIRFTDRYMRSGKNRLTAFDASEGVLYVLFAAVLALLPTSPKCLAIDNVDKALNPRLVKELIRLLCRWLTLESRERQFFVTAHNPAVLDGLDIGNDGVRLFAVDRNNLGHTTVNRIQPDERLLNLSREKGWPLSRLWVMGHLGGVPNV